MKALLAALLIAGSISFPVRAELVEAPSLPRQKGAPSTSSGRTERGQTPSSPKPKLIVAISVDQLSADLFAQYRQHWTGGFARLLTGAVFPSAYQSHAATETCPGHSTILTGMRPAHTGIIANTWIDQRITRADKSVYCAEDETIPGSTHTAYTVSDRHLKVPTLGEIMKAATPATRVVSVAGKDRAAVMMGGHRVNEIWWWNGKTFASYAGRTEPAVVTRARAVVADRLAQSQPALPLPSYCEPLDRPLLTGDQTLGQGRFARAAGDTTAWRASPAADAAVFALAAGLIQDMKLGRGTATDLIAIGASATDYVGHAKGTQGTEMCIQLTELDRTLGSFLATLDGWGVDYEVVLTADHGAHDNTDRQQQLAMPMESRTPVGLKAEAMGAAIAAALKLPGPVLVSAEAKTGVDNDLYLAAALSPADRARVRAEALRHYAGQPQVQAVYTREQIATTPMPSGPPETWTLIERARTSYDPERTGDLLVFFKPRVTAIATLAPNYVETHGSPWDYDRRVPLLFWRKGMTGFEQPLSVETVDIMPTLAATIGLPVGGVDGRCLDLDAGVADTCSFPSSPRP